MSLRAAAEKLGVSFATVRNWEAKFNSREAKKTPAGNRKVVAAAAALNLARPGTLEEVKTRSKLVRVLLSQLAPQVERGEYSVPSFLQIMRYADEIDRLRVELTPPEPKAPEDDPDVRAAERELLAKLELMIVDREKKAART